MNLVKKLAAAVAATAVASSASALTLVVNIEGTIDEYIAPSHLDTPENAQLAKSQPYSGQLVIKNYETFYEYNRDTRLYESTMGTLIDVSENANVGFTVGHTKLQQMEGARAFLPNPNFNPDLPPCSSRDISRERNGCTADSIENPAYARLSQNAANFGELLGDASLELREDGFIKEFNWKFDRNPKLNPNFDPNEEEGGRNSRYMNELASYDELLESLNFPFTMKELNLSLSNFKIIDEACDCVADFFAQDGFDGQDNEFLYLSADANISVEVQDVPVPAAAWLFGSAILGLAGIKRKK